MERRWRGEVKLKQGRGRGGGSLMLLVCYKCKEDTGSGAETPLSLPANPTACSNWVGGPSPHANQNQLICARWWLNGTWAVCVRVPALAAASLPLH